MSALPVAWLVVDTRMEGKASHVRLSWEEPAFTEDAARFMRAVPLGPIATPSKSETEAEQIVDTHTRETETG